MDRFSCLEEQYCIVLSVLLTLVHKAESFVGTENTTSLFSYLSQIAGYPMRASESLSCQGMHSCWRPTRSTTAGDHSWGVDICSPPTPRRRACTEPDLLPREERAQTKGVHSRRGQTMPHTVLHSNLQRAPVKAPLLIAVTTRLMAVSEIHSVCFILAAEWWTPQCFQLPLSPSSISSTEGWNVGAKLPLMLPNKTKQQKTRIPCKFFLPQASLCHSYDRTYAWPCTVRVCATQHESSC